MFYCPRCAGENVETASFCRSCGADIRLVPQAMTGRLPAQGNAHTGVAGISSDPKRRKSKDKEPARIDKSLEEIFIGAAFLLIFLAGLLFFRRGFMIWVWFIIPAFACIGSGVGQYLRFKHEQRLQEQLISPLSGANLTSAVAATPLPPRNTAEIVPAFSASPPSVTEATTRHLNLDAATRRSPVASAPRAEHSEDNL